MGAPGIEVGEGHDRPRLAWADFRPLFQGLLVDAEGRPVSLSATGFDSAFGQIWDRIAASDPLRRLLERLLAELGDQ